jgi:hypothetical protein
MIDSRREKRIVDEAGRRADDGGYSVERGVLLVEQG